MDKYVLQQWTCSVHLLPADCWKGCWYSYPCGWSDFPVHLKPWYEIISKNNSKSIVICLLLICIAYFLQIVEKLVDIVPHVYEAILEFIWNHGMRSYLVTIQNQLLYVYFLFVSFICAVLGFQWNIISIRILKFCEIVDL